MDELFEQEEIKEIEITMDDILSTYNKVSEQRRMADIKADIVQKYSNDDHNLFDNLELEVEKQVKSLIAADKKLGDESMLVYTKGKYRQRRNKRVVDCYTLQANDFTGRAGECAVMSELLYREYNVNHMLVDGGIDLVAFKDSSYYFIQVKTVGIINGTIRANIPLINYEKNKVYSTQMRYFIVCRCIDKDGSQKNLFFMFTQGEIEKMMHNRSIKRGEANIVIKIKFHPKTGEPILYDENTEEKAGYHFNRFDL